MPALSSSAIHWVDYNPQLQRLDITFRSGRTYTLRGVPERHYYRILVSASPGQYFNDHLRGRY